MDSEKLQLEIRSVTKKYSAKTVLDRVSLKLEPGIYGLLGPNGAGKSTLMNIIVGVLPPSAGQVVYNGQEIGTFGRKYRSILGYMPQQQLVCPNMSGAEFLSYMAALKDIPKKDRKNLIMWAASQVNMQDEMGKKLNAYSGGMKQRILLASALLNNPTVLILDEPTAGLDPKERIRIRNLISKISENKIVLIATHVVSDIELISRKVILLKAGKLVKADTIANLTSEIRNSVYELVCDMDDVEKLEKKYLVSNITSDGEIARVHLISEHGVDEKCASEAVPSLEDVYLYHFGMERD